MEERTKKYREKYIENLKDDFDVPYEGIVASIDSILENFLNETISELEAIQSLREITKDFEFSPFKWILHHIRIDNRNIEIANRLVKINPDAIVYKHFEEQDYGFNLLSDIYEKEYRRISHVERRSKLFNLSTLIDNENSDSQLRLPKISTTFFEDHKYNYGIFDWGILTVYTKGEIWDNKLKRYVISKPNVKATTRRYSFSILIGEEKYNSTKNKDGSMTIFDNHGNSETHFINGCIETRMKNGILIFEYPDGAIKKRNKYGEITELDFVGNPITEKSKSDFWNKLFKQKR